MSHYILKTGLPMYDLERAYGFGLIAWVLTGEETKVLDKGIYYEIKNNFSYNSHIEELIQGRSGEILSLVSEDLDNWNNILQTTSKGKAEKKAKAARLLKDMEWFKDMLLYYSSISQSGIELQNSLTAKRHKDKRKNYKKGGRQQETLVAPLELAATKGFREEIKCREYGEGANIGIPEQDWILTIIGALHSVIWQFVPEKENVAIIPVPDGIKGVDVSHLRDIKEFLKVKGINRVSTVTLIAHSAIKLYQEIWNRRHSDNPLMDCFTNFLYGSLVGTGQQSKPKLGGYFPLGMFEELLNLTNGSDILEHFDYIFRIGSSEGQKSLSINFAEFLAKTSIANYSKFINVYLKTILRKEKKVKKPNEDIWREVIKYVEN